MPSKHLPRKRRYNWFQYAAVANLLELLGIDEPTPDQREVAYQLVDNIRGFIRSEE
jgi:hypothetical protein